MKPLMKLLTGITLGILLGASVDAAVGTFTFKTTGASDTVEAVDLVYPQRVPEANSVSTSSIADGSVTPAKISSGYNLLTDAEKTQALVGAHTEPFVANKYTLSSTENNWNGSTKVGTYITELVSGASTTITLRRAAAAERAYSARVTITSGASGALTPAMSTVSLAFKWDANGTLASTASSAVNLGGGSTWSVALVSSGTRDLLFRLTNANEYTMYYTYAEIELFGAYANQLTYVGLQ